MYDNIIIGSGFSGIALAIELKNKGVDNFLILEKAKSLGGTWRENTYPGAECDIPSALYSYSFEPYLDWDYKWSHQPQILQYLHHCAEKYKIKPHIEYHQELTEATWSNEQSHWIVKTKAGKTYSTRTLVSAIGQLHHPSLPPMEGVGSFAGPSFHSAQWDHECDLTGKTVGVVGNAASAIQCIPEIAKVAKSVKIFQRSANWMLPKQDRLYKKWEKKVIAKLPFLLKLSRLRIWLLGGGLYLLLNKRNSWLRKLYEAHSSRNMKKHIKDANLQKALIPKYPFGAKRVLFSDDYYQTLALDHVQLITIPINSISQNGIVTADNVHKLDALIYATGFRSHPFLDGIDIKGANKLTLKDKWHDAPKNYLGMLVDDFPNFFIMYGPNTNLGHSSIIIMAEAQANYISQCVSSISTGKYKSISIKKEVLENYYDNHQKRLTKMVWADVEGSWYKTKSGVNVNNWAGRTMEYVRLTKNVAFDDFEIS